VSVLITLIILTTNVFQSTMMISSFSLHLGFVSFFSHFSHALALHCWSTLTFLDNHLANPLSFLSEIRWCFSLISAIAPSILMLQHFSQAPPDPLHLLYIFGIFPFLVIFPCQAWNKLPGHSGTPCWEKYWKCRASGGDHGGAWKNAGAWELKELWLK